MISFTKRVSGKSSKRVANFRSKQTSSSNTELKHEKKKPFSKQILSCSDRIYFYRFLIFSLSTLCDD